MIFRVPKTLWFLHSIVCGIRSETSHVLDKGMEMVEFNTDDIIEAISGAANLNAVLKKILKNEVKKGNPEERFFKEMRRIANLSHPDAQLREFLDRHLPAATNYAMVVAGYVHDTAMVDISGNIVDAYADDFNATYETAEDGSIHVTNQEKFEEIAKAAFQMIDNGLKSHKLPASLFLKSVIAHRLFTPGVIRELSPMIN